ncbi:MAG: PQQ-binding-like beta-propeller repeat protein [Halobacteriaceae archaeon]
MTRQGSRRAFLRRWGVAALASGVAGCSGGGDGGDGGGGTTTDAGGGSGSGKKKKTTKQTTTAPNGTSTTTTAATTTTATTTTVDPRTLETWTQYQADPEHTGRARVDGPDAGERAWREAINGPVNYGPVVAAGLVFVATSEKKTLYALRPGSGRTVWRTQIGAPTGTFAVADGLLLVMDSKLRAFDPVSGEQQWTSVSVAGNPDTSSAVTVRDGLAYVVDDGRRVTAVRLQSEKKDSRVKWRSIELVTPVTSPAVDGERVYLSDARGYYAHTLDTGQRIWGTYTHRQATAAPTVNADAGHVYFTSNRGDVYAVDRKTGTEVWQANLGSAVTTSPAIDDTGLFVTDASGTLTKLRQGDGSSVWSKRVGHNTHSAPVIAGDYVYLGSQNGDVFALAREDGATVWRAGTGGAVDGSPAIGTNALWIGSADRHVYAFGTPGADR